MMVAQSTVRVWAAPGTEKTGSAGLGGFKAD
jgi:hypothetical protein